MRKKHTDPAQPKSLRTFVLFCCVVALLVLGSLVIRAFTMLRESTFDPQQRFTISYVVSPNEVIIYSVDPKAKTYVNIILKSEKPIGSVAKQVGIPIDVQIQPKGKFSVDTFSDVLTQVAFMPFRYRTTMTFADAVRIYFLVQQSDEQDQITITLPGTLDSIREELGRAMYDASVVDENLTVEIINASGTAGLGVRLERLLTTAGFTVIAVNAAPKSNKTSSLQSTVPDSQTVRRLSRILNFQLIESEKQSIADVTVIIGEDSLEQEVF